MPPLDTETASKLLGRIHSANGSAFKITHTYDGREFTANWELGNTFKKNATLQIKPAAEWSQADVCQALDVVLRRTRPNLGMARLTRRCCV